MAIRETALLVDSPPPAPAESPSPGPQAASSTPEHPADEGAGAGFLPLAGAYRSSGDFVPDGTAMGDMGGKECFGWDLETVTLPVFSERSDLAGLSETPAEACSVGWGAAVA